MPYPIPGQYPPPVSPMLNLPQAAGMFAAPGQFPPQGQLPPQGPQQYPPQGVPQGIPQGVPPQMLQPGPQAGQPLSSGSSSSLSGLGAPANDVSTQRPGMFANGKALAPVIADGSQRLQLSHDTGMQLASTAMNLPTIQQPHHGPDWHKIAGIAGDFLLNYSAASGNQFASNYLQNQWATKHEQALRDAKAAEDDKDYQRKLHDPRVVGNSVVSMDPQGQYHSLFTTPQPFEEYASAQGFKPGTPEYADAVKNYRLGSWSDAALANREVMMGDRFGYMGDLQDARLRSGERNTDVRVGASTANNIRSTNTTMRGQDFSHQDRQRGQDFQHQDRQSGQAVTDARVRGSAAYQGRGGGGRHGFGGGAPAVAVGPDGHRIMVQNGHWVDAQTGQPVQ